MCGIVGARHDWLIEQGLDPSVVMANATAELAWRGPDSQAVHHAGDWWLGCARLAISDAPTGSPEAGRRTHRQPVVRRGGRFAGVMNGAITNARELWQTLLPGAQARTVPLNDAWLPLLAVTNQQTQCLSLLRGHHAYAVVDTHTGELTIGQDRYGEKPLYCLAARVGSQWQLVAFASSLPALRNLGMPDPSAARSGSRRRLAEWFRYGWSKSRTLRFSARLRLDALPARGVPFVAGPPTANGHGATWCSPHVQTDAATTPTSNTASTSLRERLLTSVRHCIDSPSRAGLFLSGGVDSSCLAFALAALDEPTPAYQFCAVGAPTSEREAAKQVATAARLPLHLVNGGPEVLDALPRLTRLAGQALGDPSILAVHAVALAAARDGVRIMLGGEGADELLLGYQRYRALVHVPRLPFLRKLGPRWSMHKAARYWRAMVATNPIRALLAVTPPAFGQHVLAPEFAARHCWHDREDLPDPCDDLALAARQDDLDNYLPRDLLAKVDIALMAAGIEGRCPYLDPDIEAFGKHRSALGKRPLREAFASELPDIVQRLPKAGFSLPLDQWFRGDLDGLDLLAEDRSRHREHLVRGGLVRAIDRHRRGVSNLGHGLYLLLAYEVYLRSGEDGVTQPASQS